MTNTDDFKLLARRRFLRSSLAAGCGASLLGTGSLHGMEPLKRDGASFKFSLAAYSYRQLLQGRQPEMTLMDFVDECARFGLEGTELTSYYFPPDVSDDDLRALRRHCFRQGLDVSGTAVGNDFGHPPGEELDAQFQLVRTWVDRAVLLGAPVIRIFAGHNHDEVAPAELHRRIVSAIEQGCEYAGSRGIHLALENHGGPTATADGLLALVRDVHSPWFGVNLDTGNFHSADVYGDLERVAPYAVNVQVKASLSGPDRQPQATDYRRLAEILQRANYRGYLVLEYEDEGDPREECRRHLDALRAAFGR